MGEANLNSLSPLDFKVNLTCGTVVKAEQTPMFTMRRASKGERIIVSVVSENQSVASISITPIFHQIYLKASRWLDSRVFLGMDCWHVKTPQLDFGVQELFFKAVPEYSPMFTSVGQVFMKSIKNVILNSKSSLCALQGMNDKHRLRTQDKLRWWSQGNLERASTNHEKHHIPEAFDLHTWA